MNKKYLAAIGISVILSVSCEKTANDTVTVSNSASVNSNNNTATIKESPTPEKAASNSISPIDKSKKDAPLSAVALTDEFNADINAGKAKYLDKPIKVEGKVKSSTKISDGDIVMEIQGRPGMIVQCAFKPSHPQFKNIVSKLKVGDAIAVDGTLVIAMPSSLLIDSCNIIR